MEKRTLGIILIVLLVLLCGCPGLCMAATGVFTTFVGGMADLGIEGFEAEGNTFVFGAGGIITGLIFVVIAVGGIIYASKMIKVADAENIEDEEIPPAI